MDLDGNLLFRHLTPEEAENAVIAVAGKPVRDLEPGEYAEGDEEGNEYVVAMAVDLEKTDAYMNRLNGKRCRAENFMWRKSHAPPDLVWDDEAEGWIDLEGDENDGEDE